MTHTTFTPETEALIAELASDDAAADNLDGEFDGIADWEGSAASDGEADFDMTEPPLAEWITPMQALVQAASLGHQAERAMVILMDSEGQTRCFFSTMPVKDAVYLARVGTLMTDGMMQGRV